MLPASPGQRFAFDRWGRGYLPLHGPKAQPGYFDERIAEVQRSRLAKSALHDIVPHIIISEEGGLSKPDPRIFEYAMKILGYPRRDTVLMVGDSLSSDIRGGINAGIDTCWYNPHGARCSGDFTPTYEIRTLHELRQLL